MANPVAFNPGSNVNGALKRSSLSLGLSRQDYGSNPGSLTWYTGVETNGGFVIYSNTYAQGASTLGNAKPTAWGTSTYSDQGLLDLINALPERQGESLFGSLADAISWLNSSGKYLIVNKDYPDYVTDGLEFILDASFTGSYPRAGTTWYDLRGTYNGTLINGATFDSTTNSISLDGTNDRIQVNSPFGNVDWSLRAWSFCATMKLDTLGDKALVQLNSATNSHYVVNNVFYTNQQSYWYFIKNSVPTQTNFTQTTGNFPAGEVFHFTMTYNGEGLTTNNISFYKNGVKLTTTNGGSAGISNAAGIQIGGVNYPLDGNVFNFLLYNKALSQAEVTQNYYGGQIVTDGLLVMLDATNPVSYPGSGTTWYDLSPNNNDFTLYNSPVFTNDNGIGVISFDGSDDYARSNSTIDLTATNKVTIISVWAQNDNTYGVMIYEHTDNWNATNNYNGISYGGFGMYTNSNGSSGGIQNANQQHMQFRGNVGYSGSDKIGPGNTSYNIHTVIHDTSQPSGSETTYYGNENLMTTALPTANSYPSNNTQNLGNDYMFLGKRGSSIPTGAYKMSLFMVYDRRLTQDEIRQNVKALKGRYNITS